MSIIASQLCPRCKSGSGIVKALGLDVNDGDQMHVWRDCPNPKCEASWCETYTRTKKPGVHETSQAVPAGTLAPKPAESVGQETVVRALAEVSRRLDREHRVAEMGRNAVMASEIRAIRDYLTDALCVAIKLEI